MKKIVCLILVILCICGCEEYEHSKFYDFFVENHLTKQVVKIVALSKTDFWISKADTFFVLPGDKIIIGSKYDYNDHRKAIDIYKPDDEIDKFDLFIDNIRQAKDFTRRSAWSFIQGPFDESSIYTLSISENTIKSN
jgi:hypothetical protein